MCEYENTAPEDKVHLTLFWRMLSTSFCEFFKILCQKPVKKASKTSVLFTGFARWKDLLATCIFFPSTLLMGQISRSGILNSQGEHPTASHSFTLAGWAGNRAAQAPKGRSFPKFRNASTVSQKVGRFHLLMTQWSLWSVHVFRQGVQRVIKRT